MLRRRRRRKHGPSACLCVSAWDIADRGLRRTIATIRTSIRLEAPIAESGNLLVPNEYIRHLVRAANVKMARSHDRARRFHNALPSLSSQTRDKNAKSASWNSGMTHTHARMYTRGGGKKGGVEPALICPDWFEITSI